MLKPHGVQLRIAQIADLSTVDWYGHVTFMIWVTGCNLRCPYCFNAALRDLNSGQAIDLEALKRRISRGLSLIEAVGVTGGEPLLQADAVTALFRWAKAVGLQTFLNSNLTVLSALKPLVEERLVDYVATDIRSPSDPHLFAEATRLPPSLAEGCLNEFWASVRLLRDAGIPVEFRITVVPEWNDNPSLIRRMASEIAPYADRLILQQFEPSPGVPEEEFRRKPRTSREVLVQLARIALEIGIEKVFITTRERGRERIRL